MTTPPQPRRSGALVDSSDPNISNAGGLSKGTRKAINDRQRKAAEADEEYAKFLDKVHYKAWPDWGKS
jgi:hypothetical protein